MPRYNRSKQQSRRKRSNRRGRSNQSLSSGSTFSKQPYQKQVQMTVPASYNAFATSVAGIGAITVTVDPSVLISHWASYSTVFDEFRISGYVVTFTPLQVGASGESIFYIDEDDAGVPTNLTAATHASLVVPNNSQAAIMRTWNGYMFSGYTLKWAPKSFTDASWQSTVAPTAFSFLKLYTDNAFHQSPLVAQSLFQFRFFFKLEFRGVQ